MVSYFFIIEKCHLDICYPNNWLILTLPLRGNYFERYFSHFYSLMSKALKQVMRIVIIDYDVYCDYYADLVIKLLKTEDLKLIIICVTIGAYYHITYF